MNRLMNRLTNNRVFIGLLLMVLQLAFLPNVRRCSGTKLLGDSCCCTASAPDASWGTKQAGKIKPKQDCCSKHASQSEGDESDPDLLASSGSAGGNDNQYSGKLDSGDQDSGDQDSGNQDSGDKSCTCSHDSAHVGLFSETTERDDLLKKYVGALLPTAARGNQSCHAIDVRVRCKPIPRARTGPPLQLIYQVFLI